MRVRLEKNRDTSDPTLTLRISHGSVTYEDDLGVEPSDEFIEQEAAAAAFQFDLSEYEKIVLAARLRCLRDGEDIEEDDGWESSEKVLDGPDLT